jgi:putative DNA methylase
MASDPIQANRVESWNELITTDRGLLILNGDSSHLPIPDASVDAVVTDPPYFDFVHYSELSDFFFAWLSPVLKSRYPWFARQDSSDQGEVQHKDPRVFARQLASVLTECCRVLKDDGVLAFSFHHSRAEGWAAIHEAITSAGLTVVAAHPVHAELRAASPKTAAKDPISLDAILVCKKRSKIDFISLDKHLVIQQSEAIARMLQDAGMSISPADRFVILASQVLIPLSKQKSNFDSVCNLLQQIHQAAQQIVPADAQQAAHR